MANKKTSICLSTLKSWLNFKKSFFPSCLRKQENELRTNLIFSL